MADHATFVRMLEDAPDDLAVLLVYADWLEEQGDLPRAEFLRLEHQVRTMTHRHAALVPTALELRKLGELLPPDWIASINHPSLSGTTWKGKSGTNPFVARFLQDGVFNYSQSGRTYQNGTWKQLGRVVRFEMNGHYADYEGVIGAQKIRGTATNVVGSNWIFWLKLTTVARVVAIPEDVIHTVFDYNRPKRTVNKATKATKAKKAKLSKKKLSSGRARRPTPPSAAKPKPPMPKAKPSKKPPSGRAQKTTPPSTPKPKPPKPKARRKRG